MSNNHQGSAIAINLFSMRRGVDPQEFAEFSASIDQPRCLDHADVVRRFDAYRVQSALGAEIGADIVEVMEVSSWESWTQLRDHDPSLKVVTTGFDRLVEPSSVRSALVVPILRSK